METKDWWNQEQVQQPGGGERKDITNSLEICNPRLNGTEWNAKHRTSGIKSKLNGGETKVWDKGKVV